MIDHPYIPALLRNSNPLWDGEEHRYRRLPWCFTCGVGPAQHWVHTDKYDVLYQIPEVKW